MVHRSVLLIARRVKGLITRTLLARLSIALLPASLASLGALGQPPSSTDLAARIAALTPEVHIERIFGDALRLKGYSVAGAVTSGAGEKRIQLGEFHEFGVTLFFEQLRLEPNQYQVLLQGSDISYDKRTGLAYEQTPGLSTIFKMKLAVDLARGQINAFAGQAGGTIRVTLTVRVPHFIVREGKIDLKLVLIMPDGTVSESQFLDHFAITYTDVALQGSDGVQSVVPNPDNLLGNPSFEDLPQGNTPGNWTLLNGYGVMQFLDAAYAVHDAKSLRFDFFGGQNHPVFNKFQDVVVKSDTQYDLSWYVRSENITSHAGPRLAVCDADKGWSHFVAAGEQVLGTTPWRRTRLTFHTPPDTTKIRVYFLRKGENDPKKPQKQDDLISGSAWFDLIELVEKKG